MSINPSSRKLHTEYAWRQSEERLIILDFRSIAFPLKKRFRRVS
jgi:hypothetical protein